MAINPARIYYYSKHDRVVVGLGEAGIQDPAMTFDEPFHLPGPERAGTFREKDRDDDCCRGGVAMGHGHGPDLS